jgi:hypothetical protein
MATLMVMKTPAAGRPAQVGPFGVVVPENGDDVAARPSMTPLTWQLVRPLQTVVRSPAHR